MLLDSPHIVEPAQRVALLVDKPMVIQLTNLLLYVLFGVFLAVLILAALAWLASESVSNDLSSVNGEILGGIWTLRVMWAAWQAKALPRALQQEGHVDSKDTADPIIWGEHRVVAAYGAAAA